MSGLGNRSFQGQNLHPDVIRRLDDIWKTVESLRSSMLTKDEASKLYGTSATATSSAGTPATSKPGTALNITNATGVSAEAQNCMIPTVTALPPASQMHQVGKVVRYLSDLWIWNGDSWERLLSLYVLI